MPHSGCRLTLTSMDDELTIHRVQVTFVGSPPDRQIARASGVTEVSIYGRRLRCVVSGSVQPFLEALRGYEVISLISMPSFSTAEPHPRTGGEKS
jgi:hypothetical protein